MKKLIFVCSHLHSGSSELCKILSEHPKIQYCNNFEKQTYSNPVDMFQATSSSHKMKNKSAIYLDHLLYNYQLSIKSAYSYCRFIYLVRSPEPVINLLISNDTMSFDQAVRHYTYRLRRLCEMFKNTPDAVLLTWEDLKSGDFKSKIENYLSLSPPIEITQENISKFYEYESFSNQFDLSDVENKYQKYLYFLKSQSLILQQ